MRDTIVILPSGARVAFANAPDYVIQDIATASLEELGEACEADEVPNDVRERARIEILIRMLKL